jgi:hypothetical protein
MGAVGELVEIPKVKAEDRSFDLAHAGVVAALDLSQSGRRVLVASCELFRRAIASSQRNERDVSSPEVARETGGLHD